jgi:excisionase family DNA binding protein
MSSKSSLWSRKDVADYLGVSPLTVLRMIQNGDLPAYKVKGQWKIKEEDVEQYLQTHSNQPRKTESPS